MSEATATMQHMTTLERLIALKTDHTTLGQIEYADQLQTYAVDLAQRWERIALVLDACITRLHEGTGADLRPEPVASGNVLR